MIKIENLTFKYEKIVFNNINLCIDKSKVTFIIGANGSGKSTLANLLSGLIFASNGKIYIDDILVNKKTNNKVLRKKIGMVFQNPSSQIIFSKVYDDIKFTLENMKVLDSKIDDIIKYALKKVKMLDYINDNPYNLSGGQKQKIAIASQLALKQDYLIFDEATSALDINSKNDIYALINELKKDIGLIVITNNMEELIYADDVLIIDEQNIYKYSINEIVNDNNILLKHHLNVPFILKLATTLNIKDVRGINEKNILESINRK